MGDCPRLDKMELCERVDVAEDRRQSCFLLENLPLTEDHLRAGIRPCPASPEAYTLTRWRSVGLEGRVMKEVWVKGWKSVCRANHAWIRGSRPIDWASRDQLPQALTLRPLPAGCTVPWPSWTEGHLHYS